MMSNNNQEVTTTTTTTNIPHFETNNQNDDNNNNNNNNTILMNENNSNDIPCKLDKYSEPEMTIARMLTNFNMVSIATNESCPIVQLGDLVKSRGRTMVGTKLVRCDGVLIISPLKSSVPPLLTKMEWEKILKNMCNSKSIHHNKSVKLYREKMKHIIKQTGYNIFVERPMSFEILLENLQRGFYDESNGQRILYHEDTNVTMEKLNPGISNDTVGNDTSKAIFDYWNIEVLPKEQRPVDMLFLQDLNLLWENVAAYDCQLRRTMNTSVADEMLMIAKNVEYGLTEEAMKVWFERKEVFKPTIQNVDKDKDTLQKAYLQLIDNMVNDPQCEIFLEPVDVEGLGLIDYNDVIKKPMDFSTLRQNVLEKNVYNNIEAFAYDLRLIFQNCCTYNPPDSYLWVLSRVLLQRTERALLAVFGRSEQIMPSIAKKHDDNNNNNNNNNIYSPNQPLLPFISFEKNYFNSTTINNNNKNSNNMSSSSISSK